LNFSHNFAFFDFVKLTLNYQIIQNGKEIMIPVNEDFIESIDMKSKTIKFNLPEGLVDFYVNE
jgi:hypothetical protein